MVIFQQLFLLTKPVAITEYLWHSPRRQDWLLLDVPPIGGDARQFGELEARLASRSHTGLDMDGFVILFVIGQFCMPVTSAVNLIGWDGFF